jgi:hypothetical protein
MARKKTPQIVAEQLPEENIKPDKFNQIPPEVEVTPITISEILETIDKAMNAPLEPEELPADSLESFVTEDKPKRYLAKSFRLWHPFQDKYISETPVELIMDGWLDSQIKAGLVVEL